MKPTFTNLLICEPKYYDKFSDSIIRRIYKLVRSRYPTHGVKIEATAYCDLNRAYLFDNKGKFHTIEITP